jgi:hypothetical protein
VKHRFINDGISPIPMGASAEYTCICGKRGTRSAIERHIAESAVDQDDEVTAIPDDDFGGGNTKAYYFPVEPRGPAPLYSDDDDSVLPPPPPVVGATDDATTLPPPFAAKKPTQAPPVARPIAELFQDMLRTAFEAGVTAGKSGEAFETWYQREVLQ